MAVETIEEFLDDIRAAGAAGLEDVERMDEGVWLLKFEDETGVGVECRGSGSEFRLVAMLGQADVDRRFTVFETALWFNSLWREHEGGRVTLSKPDGELIFEQSYAVGDHTRARFEQELAQFMATAHRWRSYVLFEPDNSTTFLPFQLFLRA